jgi:O-antigen ligase
MSRARQAILPAYLLLCLLVGGSTQGMWGNAALQLIATGILAWAALVRDPQSLTRPGKRLLLIVAALGLLILLQLLPLPPAVWAGVPGRDSFAEGFRQLGMTLPWLPLSEAPYDTLTTALTLLPPLALLVGMLRLRDWSTTLMLGAIVLGTIISVLLGVLQVTGGEGWYLYRITNLGVAVGTFANANHFATWLLVAIPSLAALAALALRTENRQQRTLIGALAMGAAAALAIGAVVTSSAALLLLGGPVIAASVLMVARLPVTRIKQGALAIILLLAVAAGTVAILGNRFPGWGTNASIETRMRFWQTTLEAVEAEGLAGSGFGTFEKVYGRYEDPASVDRFYVNHAHNDYLELALEGGIPAALLLIIFLAWWSGRAADAWFTTAGRSETKAAAVMSAAILLHSLFDYPLRTAAIASVMAVALAILGGAKGRPAPAEASGPRARHATL